MILIVATLFLAMCAPPTALALDNPPFKWPSAYSVAVDTTKTDRGDPFVNTYFVDGQKARNEIARDGILRSITILRLDQGKMLALDPSGNFSPTEKPLSPDVTLTHPFTTEGTWESLATENISGEDAVKYKVTNDPKTPDAFFYVWLDKANERPLRFMTQTGSTIRDFNNYKPGPQDQALFDPPRPKNIRPPSP